MTLTNLRRSVLSLFVIALAPGCSLLGGGALGLPGGIGGPKIPPVYGPYEVKGDLIKIGLGDRELHIQTALDVPPERGTINLRINAHGNSYDSAAEQVHKAFTDLKKIGSSPGCGFKINHYQTPDSGDNKKWQASGNADVWVDVKDADPEARITKANACFKALREYILGLPKYDPGAQPEGFEVLQPILGREVWSVESLEKHRDALVKLADDRLKAVQKADAKMWDHADVQCTSAGIIQVASSSSHWVTLQLEMICPVSPAETASAPGTSRIPGK
jgi:hypothetical protein